MRRFCATCEKEMVSAGGPCPDCGSPLALLGEDSLVGMTLADRYVVLEELGRGGMGVVYRAEQKYLNREVALKVLRKSLLEDSNNAKRFLQEARAASGLSSPHTVTVHDFGVSEDGRLYFAMELLEGETVGDLLRRDGPIAPARAVALVVQACDSLSEAHERGIWHRDIKPHNMFVTEGRGSTERLKILDFGIARLEEASLVATTAGVVCGTAQYVSPEQALSGDVDGRSDIYSLGVTLYEMLAGEPPFSHGTPVAICTSHLSDPPPPLHEKNPALKAREPLCKVVMQALEKLPADRPQTVREFGEALLQAMGEELPATGNIQLPFLFADPLPRNGPSEAGPEALSPDDSGAGSSEEAWQPAGDFVPSFRVERPDGRRGASGDRSLQEMLDDADRSHVRAIPREPVETDRGNGRRSRYFRVLLVGVSTGALLGLGVVGAKMATSSWGGSGEDSAAPSTERADVGRQLDRAEPEPEREPVSPAPVMGHAAVDPLPDSPEPDRRSFGTEEGGETAVEPPAPLAEEGDLVEQFPAPAGAVAERDRLPARDTETGPAPLPGPEAGETPAQAGGVSAVEAALPRKAQKTKTHHRVKEAGRKHTHESGGEYTVIAPVAAPPAPADLPPPSVEDGDFTKLPVPGQQP